MQSVRCALAGTAMVVALLVAGCSRSASETPGPVADVANLSGRLQAVSNIAVPQARDPMAGNVARDAASLGQVEICVHALGQISNPAQRRYTAKQCSDLLAKNGDTPGSTRVSAIQ